MQRPYQLSISFEAQWKGGKSVQSERIGPRLKRLGIIGPYTVMDGGALIKIALYEPGIDLDVPIDIGDGETITLRSERERVNAGEKATPKWLLNCLMFPEIRKQFSAGSSLIFAGQPRFADEAERFVEVIREAGAEILVVHIDVPIEVCRERAERWYAKLSAKQRKEDGYRWEHFDYRAEQYEETVPAAMDVLVAASGLPQPRVVIRDDGTMSIKAVTDAIVEAVSEVLP